MVQFFHSRTTCRFDTPGERRLAERLGEKLEDGYPCRLNVPVKPRALQPDFVLHPLRGLQVLKAKDWKLDTIQSMDRSEILCRRTAQNPEEPDAAGTSI